jgi:hypothetical protein
MRYPSESPKERSSAGVPKSQLVNNEKVRVAKRPAVVLI